MKKIILFFVLALISVATFQSCGPYERSRNIKDDVESLLKPIDHAGLIKLDSAGAKVVGYDWTMVHDSTTGFMTVPLGFNTMVNALIPRLTEQELKWTHGMLIAFQKRFNVRVTNFDMCVPLMINTPGISYTHITIFYQPLAEFMKE